MAMVTRYTDEPIICKVLNMDVTGKNPHVTISQGKNKRRTYSDTDLTMEYDGTDTYIHFTIDQRATAVFDSGRPVEFQLNYLEDGLRRASDIVSGFMLKNILEEIWE